MKVLQINTVCGIGSTGRIATDIHHMLLEAGHESYIAYGRENPRNCDNSIRIGSKLDNYLHVVRTRLFDSHGFGSRKATLRFIEKVKELDPDIIHLHNIHGYYINIEVLFGYLHNSNKPVVWTLHDCWAFTGHCAYFDMVSCEKWKKGCYACPEKKQYPSSLIMDNSSKNYDLKKSLFFDLNMLTLVTPSRWLSNLIKMSFMNKHPRVVINNGIDVNYFKPFETNLREVYKIHDKKVVLSVASVWDRRKGLNDIVSLCKRLDNSVFQIVIIGLKSDQIKLLPSNIIGLERTNSLDELAGWYTMADVFFNPSYEDNYPTTIIESLACGTPVLTYSTGGCCELITPENGYVVKKGDLQSVVNILENSVKLKFEIPIEKLSSTSLLKSYIELYKTVIDQ